MARTAISELQQQIEVVRSEAKPLPLDTPQRCKRSGNWHHTPRPVLTLLQRLRLAGGAQDVRHKQRHPIAGAQSVRSNVPQDPADRLLAGRSGAPMHRGSRRS
jgi:hypothetical protein